MDSKFLSEQLGEECVGGSNWVQRFWIKGLIDLRSLQLDEFGRDSIVSVVFYAVLISSLFLHVEL